MNERSVVYAGFFDPFTRGHLNIVERASQVFDTVIVAVAQESPKQALFSPEERFEMIQEVFKGNRAIEVDKFQGLLVNYMRRRKAKIVLRGLRTLSDFEYEFQMALANKKLAENVETFFMMTEEKYSYFSSTLIKEIARLGGDIAEMVPPSVLAHVKKKYETQSSR